MGPQTISNHWKMNTYINGTGFMKRKNPHRTVSIKGHNESKYFVCMQDFQKQRCTFKRNRNPKMNWKEWRV